MDASPAPDPNDWRTWRREGSRIFPPPAATNEQAMEGCVAFSAARWGLGLDRSRASRRNVIRVMKTIEGRYQQIRFARATERGLVDVRVYGGCRPEVKR